MTRVKKYDYETLKVFGFLKSKGLLLVDGVKESGSVKLDIAKVIRVGTEVEPRVIEVLPAALLHFPRSFFNWQALPDSMKEVLDLIKKGAVAGPELAGIPYTDMRRWANFTFKDRRAKPLSSRRVMKSMRFKPSTLVALRKKAMVAGMSDTEYVEHLINSRG